MDGLSVVIIARYEADRIGAALESVLFADEILVLDSGSSDSTPDIAGRMGATVIRTDWPGHVKQKSRALGMANGRWVLSLDADERVTGDLARSIRRVVTSDPPFSGFLVRRRNYFLGRPMYWGDWGRDFKLRLVRRDHARVRGRDPHDVLAVDGPVGRISGELEHHSFRSLGEQVRTMDIYAARAAQVSRVKARWWDLLFRPPWALFRGFILKAGFLDGSRGLLLAGLVAHHTLLKWSRIRLAGSPGLGSCHSVDHHESAPPSLHSATSDQQNERG